MIVTLLALYAIGTFLTFFFSAAVFLVEPHSARETSPGAAKAARVMLSAWAWPLWLLIGVRALLRAARNAVAGEGS